MMMSIEEVLYILRRLTCFKPTARRTMQVTLMEGRITTTSKKSIRLW